MDAAERVPPIFLKDNVMTIVPSYLKGYEDLYKTDPRKAAIQWFSDAKFGMFIHYGLYSLLGRHEWVQLREKIPVAEYAKLKDDFKAENFNADFITDLALDAGMKYINITTRHHDSFSLFETKENDFHSMNSPCGRDLVGELAGACSEKGLGLCLYYSHGRDWRHPHAPNNGEWGNTARPHYDIPDPFYASSKEYDMNKYLDFMSAQITELLTNYGPVASIWLDGIATPMAGDFTLFRCQELYDLIHSIQPQVLVSYKQGLLGTEDYFAPEHKAVENDSEKPMEICTTMEIDPNSWGYYEGARHRTAQEVMSELEIASRIPANLLLNTGPLPDGSIDEHDTAVFREVGKKVSF